MGKLKSSEEVEVTPSPPEAKQRRRCVQSKLCWGRPSEGGGVAAVQAAEVVEIREEETSEGKSEKKGGTKTRAPKKSPVNRTRSKSSLRSTGYDGCKNLKNDQNGDSNKSDAMKTVDNMALIVKRPTCDLWLEAKLASEENMRLSATKQIHPFFACRKEAKAQDTKKLKELAQQPGYVRDDINSYPSFHILDAQVDFISLDWSCWKFMEQALNLHDCCALENTLVDYGSSVEPLSFDTISLGEMHVDQVSVAAEKNHIIAESNGKYQKQQLSSYMELPIRSNLSLLSRCGSLTENQGNNHQDRLCNERRSSNSPEYSLWTAKYQPEKASEVCGNCHSVRQLSEWLKSWHDKGQKLSKCNVEVNSIVEDADDSLYETEFDTDDQEDASNLKTVLLVTGPVGSGKSAAIYACAKEQGFQVIEVSASDLRNGANIMNKFQEATKSRSINRGSLYNYTSSRNENHDVLPGAPNNIKNVEFENFEITASTDMQDNGNGGCSSITGSRVANQSLILFEDVDIVFEEDHGFISAILQLGEASKRPIVLTSNRKNPVFSPLLDRLVLDFEAPSVEELFRHVNMICAYEEAQISTCLLQQLIKSCVGDIRKVIMLLQFWCQGKSHGTVRNMHTYSPLRFDIDAAHRVLPKVILGKFRCELSEKIVDEINRTISSIEDNLKSVVSTPIEEDCFSKVEKLIKKRRLRKTLDQNPTELPTHDIELDDFSDASESLLRLDQRRPKKPRVVLSPKSDDKTDADECAEIMSAGLNGFSLLDTPIVPSLEDPCLLLSLADTKYISQRDNGVQHPFENFDTVSVSHICDTFMLQDVSCVPESSFVAGSQIDVRDNAISMAVSPNNTTVILSDFVKSIHASREANNLSGTMTQINSFSSNNVDLGSVLISEELGDSHNVDEEFPSGGLQFMDECSRADFSNYLVSRRCRESSGILSVQETWKKLRNQHEELKSYLSKNQREPSLVNLVSGLTDLISETDILFSGCNPLTSDVLEPSLTPAVEPADVSWYDEQYEIGSTYSQHGLCLYLKNCAKICQDTGFIETGDLVQEMLSSSTNAMALGKLLRLENANTHNIPDAGLQMKETRYDTYVGRKPQSVLLDAMLPIVPARLSMTVRSSGFHDYLCFTSHISKLENARISGSMKENCKRRSRSLRHYLSTGSLSLSPMAVELLSRTSCFKEVVP